MFFIIIYCFITIVFVLGNCPNNCNHHGNCDIYSRCSCTDGFIGADCSLKACPSDKAWSDQAIGIDNSHNLAECSNRGICNRVTGLY